MREGTLLAEMVFRHWGVPGWGGLGIRRLVVFMLSSFAFGGNVYRGICALFLADHAGLEPATFGFGIRCSAS